MTDFFGTTLSDHDLGYMAGIMDGEGSIYISRGQTGANRKAGSKSPVHQTVVSVSNTERGLLEWIVERFGGSIREYTPKQMPSNARRQVFSWIITGERLVRFCELMESRSVIKRQEYAIMLRMKTTYKKRRVEKGKQGIQRLSEETLAIREECFEALRALHNRPNRNHPNLQAARSEQ